MSQNTLFISQRSCALLLAICCISLGPWALAQQSGQFVEPIYRVANEQDADQPPRVATRIETKFQAPPIDLTQRPGEHPLMPALRLAKSGLQGIDANIADYSAILRKQERVNGELLDEEFAFIKVRHQPFAVYMFFLKPHKGRECLFNSLKPDTLVAMDCGWRRRIGKVELNPVGAMAMKNQKYPITKLGLRELTSELITVASSDVNFNECNVRTAQGKMKGRAVTWIEVVHPAKRSNFRFHKAEIFIDNEYRVPVRYNAYLWPEQPGGQLPLEESYTYIDLKINNGFTDIDFDPANPAYFKK